MDHRIYKYFLNNKLLLSIIFLSFTVRFIIAIVSYNNNSFESLGDDKAYSYYAKVMMEDGLFPTNLDKIGTYAGVVGPGIAWIYYLIYSIFGENWLYIFLFTAIASTLITVMIYIFGKEVFNEKVALLASAWSIIYIPFLKYVPSGGKDTWMTLLFIITLFYLIKYLKRKTTINYYLVFLSVIFTFLFHLDERFVIFIPVFSLIIFFYNKKSFLQKISRLSIFIGIVVLFSAPWFIRNIVTYDRIIIISVRTAQFTEKLFGYNHIEYFQSHEGTWYLDDSQIDSIQNGNLTIGNIFSDVNPVIDVQQTEAIRQGILPHKFNYFDSMFSIFIDFWQPCDFWYSYSLDGYKFDGAWSLKNNLLSLLSYGILLPFFLIGLFQILKNKEKYAFILIISIMLYTLLHILFVNFTDTRYRMPLDPYIILISFYAIYKIPFFLNIRNKLEKIDKL